MGNSDINIINNEEFVYLTGSVIFDKEEKLSLSKPNKYFYYLFSSSEEFRNIIQYFIEIFSKHNEIDKRINFALSIDSALSQYFVTFLEKTQEYIFHKDNYILSLGFNHSKIVNRTTNNIIHSTNNNWNQSIDFFLCL